jgi:hypothetical protein
MARYVCTVPTPLAVQEAWARMCDARTYGRWDPSIVGARQVAGGDGPGPRAAVELTFAGVGPWRTLRYEVREYAPPHRMVIEARSTLLHSYDVVTVEPASDGSVVTYDAQLRLNGPLGLADPLLRVGFTALSSRAAAGLRRYLAQAG